MYYIIDANNLAGKLHLLRERDFDKRLIELVKKYNKEKNTLLRRGYGGRRKITLVFDSADPMGDKVSDGRLTVIYTPRDNYYKSADDKIIELVKIHIGIISASTQMEPGECASPAIYEEITVITDDLEIGQAVKKLAEKTGKKVYIQSATSFAEKLEKVINNNKESVISDNKEELSDEEVKRIDEEMLRIWQ